MDEDLNSLIRRLKDESMFVQSEKKHLVDLYDQVLKKFQFFHLIKFFFS